ncbi:MAG: YaaA family protein [Dysgonomonas sp.]
MIVTMSPAKLLDFKTSVLTAKETLPQYGRQAKELNELLSQLDVEELKALMKINPSQAMDVFQYVHGFDLHKVSKRQAVFVYNGIAYSGLDPRSMSESDIDYAQDHLIIFSGLYGMLRPLDLIKPYRLELQTKLVNPKGDDLYKYWREELTSNLKKRLSADDKIWINLTSSEYTKAIDKKRLPVDTTIITPDFKQQTANGYRQVIVHTKKARGMLARFILQNRLTSVEDVKGFDAEGYYFSEELSTKGEFTFVR